MTPTEAIASIRASIAAGLSPSLSDIEVLIAELSDRRADVDSDGFTTIPVRAAWLVEQRLPTDWACIQCRPDSDMLVDGFQCYLHQAKAALTTQPPRNENG